MSRGPDPLRGLTVDCVECGTPFPVNPFMRSRFRELEAFGLADAVDFVCAACAAPYCPPLSPPGPFNRGFSDA